MQGVSGSNPLSSTIFSFCGEFARQIIPEPILRQRSLLSSYATPPLVSKKKRRMERIFFKIQIF
jgi:hypothetical protein